MRTHRFTSALLAVTVGALAFQVAHTAEHVAQMVMWVAHPQRAPWMSSWAMDLSHWLGGIDVGRASETTLSMTRGMEYLHLVGNTIFLVGLLAMGRVVPPGGSAAVWTRRATIAQSLHLAEHVLLVASLAITGRTLGASTWFGLLGGTQLSTHRVWWHGLINLVATGLALTAVVAWRREVRERPAEFGTGRRGISPALAAFVLVVPLSVAMVVGQPLSAGGPGAHVHGERPTVDPGDSPAPPGTIGFVDVASNVGLDVQHSAFRWDVTMDPVAMMGGGVCWIDADRDGWLDLFVTDSWSDGEWGLWNNAEAMPTTRLYRNDGGVFVDHTDEWGVDAETRANGCVVADLDDDGFSDLYVTSSRSNVLFLNRGGTGFDDVSADSGTDAYGWHTGAAAGDVDLDGDLDLVVAGYADPNRSRPEASTGFPNTIEPIADLVLVNDGPGADGVPRFRDVSAEVGLEPAGPEYGLGTALFDADRDGDLDLLVANDTQPNRLYRNETVAGGPVTFDEVGAAAGADDPNSGMGVLVADLDGDELDDLVVTNLAGQGHAALRATDDTSYTPSFDGLEAVGDALTGWGVTAGDFDLDGDLDAIVASGEIPIVDVVDSGSALTLLTNTDGVFADTTAGSGVDAVAPRNGRAAAVADYDNDGDLDVAVSAIGQPLVLLENRTITEGSFLLVDPGAPAPGLIVTARLADGRVITRQALAGSSWLSGEDHRLHLGVGDVAEVESVEVRRPGGEACSFELVATGGRLELAGSGCGAVFTTSIDMVSDLG